MKLILKIGSMAIVSILALCAIPAESGRMDCKSDCKQRLNDKTKICDAEFRSGGSAHQGNVKWHKECLAAAKSEYDSCLATCKAE